MRYGIAVPDPIRDVLQSGRGESLKPGDARIAGSSHVMIAAPQMALPV